jgi:hypothetical protein
MKLAATKDNTHENINRNIATSIEVSILALKPRIETITIETFKNVICITYNANELSTHHLGSLIKEVNLHTKYIRGSTIIKSQKFSIIGIEIYLPYALITIPTHPTSILIPIIPFPLNEVKFTLRNQIPIEK